MENKVCNKCGEEKPNTKEYYYGNGGATADGLTATCKVCRLARNKELQQSYTKKPGVKECATCKTIKDTKDFYSDKTKTDGFSYQCKTCAQQRDKKVRQKEKNIPQTKICCDCGETKSHTLFFKDRRNSTGLFPRCKDCHKILEKQYRENETPEQKKKRQETLKKNNKKYNEIGVFPSGLSVSESRKKRQERYKPKRAQRRRQIRNTNPLVKLKEKIYSGISRGLKGKSKLEKTEEVLGCKIEYFKSYIEIQFQEGMTWDNFSKFGWHLDHIIPISQSTNEEEVYILNHYINFQPLWWEDNLSKGDKLPEEWLNEYQSN